MSGFAAFLNEDQITFATDTLVTKDYKFPYEGVNSISKVNYYPHLNCAVVGLGYSALGDDYYKFIQTLIINDIEDLIQQTKWDFIKTLNFDDYPEGLHETIEDGEHLGNLYVMGYSLQLKKLVAYNVAVHKKEGIKVVDMRTDFRMFVHPPISEEDQKRIADVVIQGGGNYGSAMVMFVQQMTEDTHKEERFTVAVGMDIHLTTMVLSPEGNFSVSFCNAHRLPNYEEEFKKIKTRKNVIDWNRTRMQYLQDKVYLFEKMAEFFTVKTKESVEQV